MNVYLFGSGKALEIGYSFLKKQKQLNLILVYLKKKDLPNYLINTNTFNILSFLKFKKKIKNIEKIKSKILVSISFKKKIDNSILKVFKNKCYNIHPAQLPNYRGCFPTCWPILDKKKYAYYTLHLMKKKFDNGNILSTEKVLIAKNDNAIKLYHRLLKKIPNLLNKNLKIFLGKKQNYGKVQNSKKAKYFKGNINFDLQKSQIFKSYNLKRLVDVFYSKKLETFFFIYKKKKIKLLKIQNYRANNNLMKLTKILYTNQNHLFIKLLNNFYKIVDIIVDDKVIKLLNYKKLKQLI